MGANLAENSKTPLLDTVKTPSDTRDFSVEQLKQLSDELRHETIDVVSKTGGHLGASLGVIELTAVLHHVFNTPHDRLVWDVSHQAYPHKILTGRREELKKVRTLDGISGFPKREESVHDHYNTGHAGTSISQLLGEVVARDINQGEFHLISVIGDASISAGITPE